MALQGSFTIYLGANRGRGQAYPTGKLVNGESIVLSCQLSGEWLYVRLYPRCDHLHVSWLRVIALTDTDEGYVWSGAARCMDLEPTAYA